MKKYLFCIIFAYTTILSASSSHDALSAFNAQSLSEEQLQSQLLSLDEQLARKQLYNKFLQKKQPIEQSSLNQQLLEAVIHHKPLEVVNALKKGADIAYVDEYRKTAVYYAARLGDTDTLAILLKHGADINTKTPFYNMETNYDITPLHIAALFNKPESIKLLVEHGADIHAQDAQRNTPLHYAALNKSKESIALLIHYGSNSDIKNNKHETPIELLANAEGIALARKLELNIDELPLISAPEIELAADYVYNLNPGVSRRWHTPIPLSLREATLKKMYDDYINNNPSALQELFLNLYSLPSTTQTLIKDTFKISFIRFVQALSETTPENKERERVRYSTLRWQERKESDKRNLLLNEYNQEASDIEQQAKLSIQRAREQVRSLIQHNEQNERNRLIQEHDQAMSDIAQQAKLDRVRAKQQQQVRMNTGL